MASAGVVGMAEVVTPNATATPSGMGGIGSVATWSFIWVGGAALFLVFFHLAMIGRGSR
jgi:hypothetical protein